MRPLMLVPLLAMLTSCDRPWEAARREVDRSAQMVRTLEASYKRLTRETLNLIAKDQSLKRTVELDHAKCSVAGSQPATATPTCLEIVDRHKRIYGVRCQEVTEAAKKVDAAVGAAYAAMLMIIDLSVEVEAGFELPKTLGNKLSKMVRIVGDVRMAYDAFKKAIAVFSGGEQ